MFTNSKAETPAAEFFLAEAMVWDQIDNLYIESFSEDLREEIFGSKDS
jgi:hypothetical protein